MPLVLNCSGGKCDHLNIHESPSVARGCVDRVHHQSIMGTSECADRFVSMEGFAYYQEMTWAEAPLENNSTLTYSIHTY